MVLMGGIESLIDFFSFTVSFFYALAMVALLVLRRTRPNLARPYKVPFATNNFMKHALQTKFCSNKSFRYRFQTIQVPIIVPIIVLVASILLMVCPIIDNPKVEYIYSILFTVGGALTYVPFVRYNIQVPLLSK